MKPEEEVLTVTWVKAEGVRVVTLSSYDTCVCVCVCVCVSVTNSEKGS